MIPVTSDILFAALVAFVLIGALGGWLSLLRGR
jgi:hypothetical protein